MGRNKKRAMVVTLRYSLRGKPFAPRSYAPSGCTRECMRPRVAQVVQASPGTVLSRTNLNRTKQRSQVRPGEPPDAAWPA